MSIEEEGTPEAPKPFAPSPPERSASEERPRSGAGGGRRERPSDDESERPRRRFGRRKVCGFCVEKVRAIDYKDPSKFRRYVSDRGRIEPRRKTGTCTKHQRWLSVALKRARHLALLPYTPGHIRLTGVFTPRR